MKCPVSPATRSFWPFQSPSGAWKDLGGVWAIALGFVFPDASYTASIALLNLGLLTVTWWFQPLSCPFSIALGESTRLYKGGM